jgi:hypothetical protein
LESNFFILVKLLGESGWKIWDPWRVRTERERGGEGGGGEGGERRRERDSIRKERGT